MVKVKLKVDNYAVVMWGRLFSFIRLFNTTLKPNRDGDFVSKTRLLRIIKQINAENGIFIPL